MQPFSSPNKIDFWNLEKLSRIDRALLYRIICLDYNRGRVFLRISRVMEQILESSPKDMELDAFALSKMVQVVELSGVLDLKALRRWNGLVFNHSWIHVTSPPFSSSMFV